jgi:radical SAM protein with 4Fe4S-binding SPASM domain
MDFSKDVKSLCLGEEVILVNLKTSSFIKLKKDGWNFLENYIRKNESKEMLTTLNSKEIESLMQLIAHLKEKGYLVDSLEGNIKTPEESDVCLFPKSAYYEVTKFCNLKCKFCYANPKFSSKKVKGNLDLTKQILIRAKENLNVKVLALSGGEPLLREDIFEIIKFSKENFEIVALTTNGVLINKEMAKKLKENGIDQISISIESPEKTTHDNLRGKGTFDKCLEAITYLKSAGFTRDTINICATINSYNLWTLERFRKFANDIDVSMSFSLFQPAGRGAIHPNFKLKRNEFGHFLINLWDQLKSESFLFGSIEDVNLSFDKLSQKMVPIVKNRCGMVEKLIGIKENGDCVPCHLFFSVGAEGIVIGNVMEETIGDKMRNFLNRLPTVDDKEKCKECNVRYFCGGGCYASSYFEYGSFFKPHPNCEEYEKYYSSVLSCLGKEDEAGCFYKALYNCFAGDFNSFNPRK